MKAKELYAKHKDAIIAADKEVRLQGVSDLLYDCSQDLGMLLKSRNPKGVSAILGCVEEINEKYNAVRRLFEKEYGASPLKPDGFRMYWEREMPEMKLARDMQMRARR